MEQTITNNQFREDEITIIRDNIFPKVAGRLRLAHEQNDSLSISTEVIRYDESIAVVRATCTTSKGTFSGIGMASMDRDRKIAPAILELAETRSIARALRFSGYGLEYCSAEEVSHTGGSNGAPFQPPAPPQPQGYPYQPPQTPQGNNTQPHGNGNGRITGKQHKYIITLLGNTGRSKKDMDDYCVRTYGTTVQHLSKQDASSLIKELQAQ
jgi:hypothetical protein